jgi:hypothetical protein
MPDFPAAVPDLPDATVSETLFTMHANAGHVPATNRILLNLRGLAGKLGIGASTPSGAGVLRQSGVAGTSAWGQVQPGDISPGAGNGNRSLLVNPGGTAVVYAAVPSGGLVGAGAGSPNTVARTTDGTNVVYGKVTSSDIQDGTIAPADIAAGGTADMLLGTVNGTQAVMTKVTTAMVPDKALNASSLFGGNTGNRVLRTTDGQNALWGQVGTLDIAPGATLGFWSVVGVPANYAGTPQNSISGATLTVSMAGANPLLIGVTLSSVFNLTAPATLTVEIWEGGAAVHSVGGVSINASELRGLAKTVAFAPTAGAHTYFLTWAVSAGTVSANTYSFWAMEIRR